MFDTYRVNFNLFELVKELDGVQFFLCILGLHDNSVILKEQPSCSGLMKTVLANVFLPTLLDFANNIVEPEPAGNQMGQCGTILLTTLSNKVKKI